MRASPCLAWALAASLLLAAAPAQERDRKLRVDELFRSRCATCHTVPDPAIPTDLAWLDQVKRTT
ncbi:MAG: hypothetical protein ACE5F1_10425 [Planctomycetota bacterium]